MLVVVLDPHLRCFLHPLLLAYLQRLLPDPVVEEDLNPVLAQILLLAAPLLLLHLLLQSPMLDLVKQGSNLLSDRLIAHLSCLNP